MPGVAASACCSAGFTGASSITSHSLSMRSRSRPFISRSWRCMNNRCSQASAQAPLSTTTSNHCPARPRSTWGALPSSGCAATAGMGTVGWIRSP